MPFVKNELTENANPLKLREYLAAGLPVVSTDIPEAVAVADRGVFLADGADAFVTPRRRGARGGRRTGSCAIGRDGARELGRRRWLTSKTLLMELKTMTVDLETLRGMPLFADLDEPAMFSLSGAAEQSYPRGATIVRANEPARSVFIVREGGVKEAQITPEGKEVILALHGPGDIFGELAQFHGNQMTATCTTLLPTQGADGAARGLGAHDHRAPAAQRAA